MGDALPAALLHPQSRPSLAQLFGSGCRNIILGIVGAALASAILSIFGISLGGWIGYLICGFIGACILIAVVRMIRGAA